MGRHSRFFAVPREGDDRPIDRDTVRRVVATFRPYRRKVSLVGLLIVITSGLGVVNPLLIAWIFNQGLFGNPPGTCRAGASCPQIDVVYLGVALDGDHPDHHRRARDRPDLSGEPRRDSV